MESTKTKVQDDNIRFHSFVTGTAILIVSQILAFFLAFQQKAYIEIEQITPPQITAELPLLYFFGATVIIGLILFLMPQRVLRLLLKLLFTFLFTWGIFIALGLSLPVFVAGIVAVAVSSFYLIIPKIWLHNLLMVVALASMATVFGILFVPWTIILLMLVISVYDVLVVRFGYMMWMVKRLSVSEVLPAFIIPMTKPGWNLSLRAVNLFDEEKEKEFSILGGGDIAFPLLLIVSVFFTSGFFGSIVVALFALLGLGAAYWVQQKQFKGKPTPALPPIALLSIVGFLVVYFT
ncbi:presenilin family intramembrane aspartyl protease [Chloroflexota bacterium]